MTPIQIRYPLDPSGNAPSNRIDGERHTLSPNRRYRCFATDYGAFFSKSVVIRDLTTGLELTPDQYFFSELYELPSDRYGKEIFAIVIITDPEVGTEIEIDYQCLGGEYGTSATAVIQMIEKLQLDDRPIEWGDIINKPTEFRPVHHYHDVGDVYGFEYEVHALERIRQAILIGDAASHDVIYKYIDGIDAALRNLIVANNEAFVEHTNNIDNPHKVTADQLNCYVRSEVDRFVNTLTQAVQAHVNDHDNPHQVTAAQLKVYLKTETDTFLNDLEARLTRALAAHTSNQDNPHKVTAAQLSCYTIAQIDQLLSSINNAATTHLKDFNNPHKVTAAQVGLGNVSNFTTALPADVVAGASSTTFVTPAGVKAMRTDHAASGDHDARYIKKGVAESMAITEIGGKAYVYIAGAWRQFWPAVWQ